MIDARCTGILARAGAPEIQQLRTTLPRSAPVTSPKRLRRAEWALTILLSVTVISLLVVRATHAGALWRDEAAVVQLARMSSLTDIAHNFQHEAFPIPFPLLIRLYTSLFSTSDAALRGFGFIVGLAVIGALWLNTRLVNRDLPIIGLALFGLNTTFLVWGTTVRGYGLGSALIILTFGLVARILLAPARGYTIAAAIAAICSVQCLVHNLVLLSAIAGSAALVLAIRRRLGRAIVCLALLALGILSFAPYLNAYSSSSTWSQVVQFPVTSRLLWNQFSFALGNPKPLFATLWHVTLVVLVGSAIWRVHRSRNDEPTIRPQLLLFGVLTILSALVGYYLFLQTLSYLARSWYYLALLAMLATALDCLAANLADVSCVRIGRIVFAVAALLLLPFNAWPSLVERQTNIDIVAREVTQLAKPDDLVVIAPWQYGISFRRYYHGETPSITLPTIVDLQVHRYDLFREKMLAPRPIDDVLRRVSQTLAAGHRVWFVGGIRLPPADRPPLALPAPPVPGIGWDNVAYSEAWIEQLGVFVRTHAAEGTTVAARSSGPINNFEAVPLFVVAGWQ
jgi:hypothetical protein